jgi:RNA polymerase sigma-70 factor (ECF subfamily)
MQNQDSETVDFSIRYESLYRNYYKAIRHTAQTILRDPYLAEDAAQQTFLRLLMYKKHLLRLKQGEEWLYMKAVLRNVCFQILEERRYASSSVMQEQLDRQLYVRAAEDDYMSAQLEAVLGDLPEKYGEPLKLHYLEMYSYEEIGKLLGVRPATVRKRAERGKKMLAGWLKSSG